MNAYEEACRLLPSALRAELERRRPEGAEEIRLRVGRPASLVVRGTERELTGDRLRRSDIMQVLERATGASLHSAAASLANGYISCRGLRIGICGEAVISGETVAGFRSYSSLAVRIPGQCRGACDELAARVFRDGVESALVLSPPGYGKTTALRELTRLLSDSGVRTGVVDERNELSAVVNGEAGFELGRCSDILVGVPKALGAMMLLRGMNPELIVMDEITRSEDMEAIRTIGGCGVAMLASAHGRSREDMLSRPLYRELLSMGVFKWLITIDLRDGRRSYDARRLTP